VIRKRQASQRLNIAEDRYQINIVSNMVIREIQYP